MHILSVPNTHRLSELFVQLSYFWLHPVWIGEMNLERCHQRVKRLLKKSNNKDEHLFAMMGIRFSDWMTRLRSCLRPNADSLAGPNWSRLDMSPLPEYFVPAITNIFDHRSHCRRELLSFQQSVMTNICRSDCITEIVGVKAHRSLLTCEESYREEMERILR